MSLAPQQPWADTVRAEHAQIDATAAVRETARRLSRTARPQLNSIRAPQLLDALRADPVGAGDAAMQVLAPMGEDAVARAFATARAIGGKNKPIRLPAVHPDLGRFEDAVEDAERVLQKALGSGRRRDRVSPLLRSAVETALAEARFVGDVGREQVEDLAQTVERLEDVDAVAVLAAAEHVVRAAMALDDERLLKRWRGKDTRSARGQEGVEGDVLIDRDTAIGRMVVGGFGKNSYDCSRIDIVIDLGGDDEYRGAVAGASGFRQMAVVVDVQGNDRYAADDDSLGSATLGLGILVDTDGNDTYVGGRRSAGVGFGGVGVFVDTAGDDQFELGADSAGVGFGGVGVFVDAEGDDRQQAGERSFGVGMPGGIGVFADATGKDERLLGASTLSLTDQGGGQPVSVGFGAGLGMMPVLAGGVGAFVDGGGDDTYRAGSLALGVGVRGGAGLFRDVAGDDRYQFGEFGAGAAFAAGFGVCVDSAGADDWRGRAHSLGAASALGVAWFVDVSGNDCYHAEAPSLGAARSGGIATFMDLAGADGHGLQATHGEGRVIGVDVPKLGAIGVFIDDGGSMDDYQFVKVPSASNFSQRVIEVGDGVRERQAFIDR